MATPTTHARLAPSSSNRWIPCPASAIPDPPDTSNAASREGTLAHDFGSEVLLGNMSIEAVPEQFRDGVQMYVNYVRSLEPEHLLVERNWESIEIDDLGGTIDCMLLEGGVCTLIDFKYGTYGVKADANPQLMTYAVIVSEHFVIDEFRAAIVQPRSTGKQKIKEAEFTPDQVEAQRRMIERAAVSDEKHTGFHCLFCPLLLTKQCDEGHQFAQRSGWLARYKHLREIYGD